METIMSILGQSGLSITEWTLLLVIVIGLPIESEIALRIHKPRILAGRARARVYTYIYSICSLWAFAMVILLVWGFGPREWADLGFQFTLRTSVLITCVVCSLIMGYFCLQLYQIQTSSDARAQYRKAAAAAGGTHYFMPQTQTEYRIFALLSVTAGITEEIIFRGFLIWAFATIMPEWAAATTSLAIFVFVHRYQGVQSLLPVTIVGGVMTMLYLASGSLYPVIAVHIVVDVLYSAVVWRARQAKLEGQSTQAPAK